MHPVSSRKGRAGGGSVLSLNCSGSPGTHEGSTLSWELLLPKEHPLGLGGIEVGRSEQGWPQCGSELQQVTLVNSLEGT